MMKLLKDFIREEDGMGTIEVIVIISILLAIALLFKNRITSWVTELMNQIFHWD